MLCKVHSNKVCTAISNKPSSNVVHSNADVSSDSPVSADKLHEVCVISRRYFETLLKMLWYNVFNMGVKTQARSPKATEEAERLR